MTLLPPRWWLHLIVVRRFEYASDPESYTSASVATGRASLAGQVKGRRQTNEIRKRKANWIGRILRRNCLLKQVIEGKIKGEMEVTRRRGRRRKKLLDDLKDRRGYCHLKCGAGERWRRSVGPIIWEIKKCYLESRSRGISYMK